MQRLTPISRTAALGLLAGLALALAACGTGSGSAVPATGPAASPTFEVPGETAEDTSEPTVDPNLPGQEDVEGWGPIWDAVAPSYPVFEGATEADADTGPVSAAYTVKNVDAPASEIAQFYLDALDTAGFGTGLDGPLEDGSYTVWSDSGYGCSSLVTVLPRGAESLITVLFGAGCPFS